MSLPQEQIPRLPSRDFEQEQSITMRRQLFDKALYDELNKIISRGSIAIPETGIEGNADTDLTPSPIIQENLISIRGISLITEFRRQRAEKKANKIQHTKNVIRATGESIVPGEYNVDAPKEHNTSWAGYMKREVDRPSGKGANILRPVTLREKYLAWRLEGIRNKINPNRNNSRHLQKAHPINEEDAETQHYRGQRLTFNERQRESRAQRKINKLNRSINGARTLTGKSLEEKFNQITTSDTLHGRINNIRVSRLRRKSEKLRSKIINREEKRSQKDNERVRSWS